MTSVEEPDVACASAWNALIGRMVHLPTVKMAHEFLCELQALRSLGPAFLGSPVWARWLHAKFPEMDPVTGAVGPAPWRPVVGDDVLYVSYGTPGGRYLPEERTARVTAVGAWLPIETTGSVDEQPGEIQRVMRVWDPLALSLFVMNPGGVFHPSPVEFDPGRPVDDAEDPTRVVPGARFGDRVYEGGTWHWPADAGRRRDTSLDVALDPDKQLRAERLAAGHCPEHGDKCASWVTTLGGGGSHVGAPRWRD